jgi:Glycosyl transferases group 1
MELQKFRVAIHNIHEIPNLFSIGIHNYVIDLLRNGDVNILFFDISSRYFSKKWVLNFYLYFRSYSKIKGWNIPWNNIKIVFSVERLNRECDVLLNFNSHLGSTQFPRCLRKFQGVKIYHVNDYFWNRPGSELNDLLVSNGVDLLMGYSRHDKYCSYFQKTFSNYSEKLIAVPFGYSDRFKNYIDFRSRLTKCIAMGSVNPMEMKDYDVVNYREVANFFPSEKWMHKFRRDLVINVDSFGTNLDSMLPVFPQYKDFRYNIVEKFNEYKMFVSCESIYNFPPAKYFEGLACGSVLICSDHECNKDLQLLDGVNCIMYIQNNLNDFRDKLTYYVENHELLPDIQLEGLKLAVNSFSHKQIANNLIKDIYARCLK